MSSEAKFLMAQFLNWVERHPRTYDDVRDAWQSTCPLNCAWEDATTDSLVTFTADGTLTLTDAGRNRLSHSG